MANSAIGTPTFQAKAENIQNTDGSSIYSGGTWIFKNGSGTTNLFMDSSGLVGIGTSSPTFKVDAALGSVSSATNGLRLSTSNIGNLVLGMSQASTNMGTASTSADIYTTVGLDMRFGTNGAERMRIDASGNLLVGVNAQVSSGYLCLQYSGNLKNGIVSNDADTGAGTNNVLIVRRNGTQIGSISTSSTNTSFNIGPSDYRLKDEIVELSGGLEKIKSLRPVAFKWKKSGESDIGFIAHEIQQVIPQCVNGDKDAIDEEGNPSYQSIFPAPAQMIANLVSAIQEQQAQIESLKSEIEALKLK